MLSNLARALCRFFGATKGDGTPLAGEARGKGDGAGGGGSGGSGARVIKAGGGRVDGQKDEL